MLNGVCRTHLNFATQYHAHSKHPAQEQLLNGNIFGMYADNWCSGRVRLQYLASLSSIFYTSVLHIHISRHFPEADRIHGPWGWASDCPCLSGSLQQKRLQGERLVPWGVSCMICNVPPTLDHWEARCTDITSRSQGSSDRIT